MLPRERGAFESSFARALTRSMNEFEALFEREKSGMVSQRQKSKPGRDRPRQTEQLRVRSLPKPICEY